MPQRTLWLYRAMQFLKHTLYRNPAGHVDVLSRESAEECYTRVVGVGKVDAFRFAHEVQGLIMTLYGYLK